MMTLNERGTLFLVATPIGNLEDTSFRVINTLKEVDHIFCEDTRRSLYFIKHFEIQTKSKIESFHDHSPKRELFKIQRLLESGKSVAYLTDGGMPVVSDPGFVLVRMAYEIQAKVTVIPGPSAAVVLFAASGLASPKYFFHGFFPRTKGEVEKTIELIGSLSVAHLFYEAPGRILSSLEIMARNFPDAQICVGRELSKLHEQWFRGTAKEVYENLTQIQSSSATLRGEFVFGILHMVEKKKEKRGFDSASLQMAKSLSDQTNPIDSENMTKQDLLNTLEIGLSNEQRDEIAVLVKSGVSSKDVAKLLSKKFGVSRRVIYEFIIHHLT